MVFKEREVPARYARVGEFGVRTIRDIIMLPFLYRGLRWTAQIDTKLNIIKFQFSETKGRETDCVSAGIWVREILGDEDLAICYYDEDSFYLSPYSKGEEYLRSCLKKAGVKI